MNHDDDLFLEIHIGWWSVAAGMDFPECFPGRFISDSLASFLRYSRSLSTRHCFKHPLFGFTPIPAIAVTQRGEKNERKGHASREQIEPPSQTRPTIHHRRLNPLCCESVGQQGSRGTCWLMMKLRGESVVSFPSWKILKDPGESRCVTSCCWSTALTVTRSQHTCKPKQVSAPDLPCLQPTSEVGIMFLDQIRPPGVFAVATIEWLNG